jgi:hypothetical protein
MWIGICGKKRSGKDVVADYLVANYAFEKKKIADDLKTVIKLLFNFTSQQLEDDTKDHIDARWNITPRTAMQFIGTDIMQFEIQKIMPHIGRNFWIDSFLKKIANTERLVISDIRFKHEYEAIKHASTKFIMIRLERPDHNNQQDQHSSETEFTEIPADITIKNDGTIEDLTSQISRLVDQ